MSSRDIMPTLSATRRGLGSQERAALERIHRSGRAVVRLDRDGGLFAGFGPNALRLVLKRLVDGGWLRRLERGTYEVTGLSGAERRGQLAVIADWLDGEPYVVSGFFALAYWNVTGHSPTTADVLLPRRKPNVSDGTALYRFIYVPRAKLPEAREVRVGRGRSLARVATPERALADVAAGRYAVDLETLRELFERGVRFGILRRRRLLQVLRHAPSAGVRRIGWIAEHSNDPLAGALRPLVGNRGYVALDPRRPARHAARNTEWRLLENAELF